VEKIFLIGELILPLSLGLTFGAILYFTLIQITLLRQGDKKSLALFSFSLGMALTWWLYKNPNLIVDIMNEIYDNFIFILLAVFTAILIFWRKSRNY